ncbi:MAG TPA: hypothetical protein PK748_03465, partial [Acidimicrobiales bacterium]|nr:hypothetical protein [Acidimicrobiales bacterium]
MADLGYDGKVAVITGAGGGLGRSHALELARRGARGWRPLQPPVPTRADAARPPRARRGARRSTSPRERPRTMSHPRILASLVVGVLCAA